METDKWSIDKLGNSNWITWKFQMRHYLLSKGLWKYVDGTEVLAEDATDAVQRTFRDNSQKALSTIVMAISTPQLYLVTSCESPKDVWDTLRNHFERETLAYKLFLKKKYFRKEMKEGMSMEAHLKEMKEITDKLASIGAAISEEDQVVTLLGSLPSSYSTIVTALEARVDDVSLNFVQQALVHEEQKQKDASKPDSSPDSALYGKGGYRPRKQPVCWDCQVVGHIRRFCPKNRPADKSHKASAAEQCAEKDECEYAFPTSGATPNREKWIIDSGATSHMTFQKHLLHDYREFDTPEKVGLGDGRVVDAVGTGSVCLTMQFKVSNPKRARMHKVLYVPKLACNLFSVRAAAQQGNLVKFGFSKCWIRNREGGLLGMGSLNGSLYHLDCEPILPVAEQASAACEQSADLWHQRLGHVNAKYLSDLYQKEMVTGMKLPKETQLSFCEGCVKGKMHRQPFKSVGESHRSSRKLQLVHSDVCGPMDESIGGKSYFVSFIDDYSRCCAVYFMNSKSGVFEKFKEFEAIATNESEQCIGTLRTDNGGEYVSKEFEAYLKSKGIKHQLTIAYTPEQNGVAERMNRTIMESARAMMSHANVPGNFWARNVGN